MRPAIILFAKAPVAGRVKTRLEPALGAEAALELHKAFVLDMLDKLSTLSGAAAIELHTDIETDVWRPPNVVLRTQISGDLGSRMLHALGGKWACIVGSDAPTLPVSHIEALLASPADVALGPCEDGGYYAVSCRCTHSDMFRGVEWSSARALEQTEESARRCGLTVARGPGWYDVDRPEDLRRLGDEANLPKHTRLWFEANDRQRQRR
jgi:rSAM/selenodomain-associated transferase 1